MRKLAAALCALVMAMALVGLTAGTARADDSAPITQYHVNVNLTEQGVAEVTIDMTMDFSVVSGRGPYLNLIERQDDGANPEEEYVFEYSNISVTSSTGAATNIHKSDDYDVLTLRIGDEDIVNHTAEQYTIRYDVKGLIVSDHPKSGLDEFNWNVIGSGWESSFEDIAVTVTGPAAVSKASCFYGPSVQDSCAASTSTTTATYSLDSLPPNTAMQVVAGFPAGTFGGVQPIKAQKITPGYMFQLTPATGIVSGLGIAGALAWLWRIRRRHARDDVYLGLTPGLTPAAGQDAHIGAASGKTPVTVQFHPPKGATPGEIGTLIDASADDVDVTSTMIDLAVRGWMRIESTGQRDFTLYRLPDPVGDELKGYEFDLLRGLFQGSSVRTSQDLRDASYSKVLPDARNGLYSSVVALKWFKKNPKTAQYGPIAAGVGALLLAFGLIIVGGAFGWGLLAIPVAIFGIGLLVLSGRFRSRTALGSAMLAQAKGFELYLRTAEKETLRFEQERDIFSRYLPYAMVFGVADRWTALFAQLGVEGIYQADTSWYHGADLYQGLYFAHAMNNLTHSMSGAMHTAMSEAAAEAMRSSTSGSSGFSGFSGGGGFGGGGGGSW